jgi:hypothetical protein
MQRATLLGVVLFGCVGCAASTGVLPAGPDTYTVTERFAPVRGGSVEAQKVATTEANAYCAQQGRQYFPLNMSPLASMTGQGTQTGYSITFRCLPPGDPELTRPHFERPADAVIEQRNR